MSGDDLRFERSTVEQMYGDWDYEAAVAALDRGLDPRPGTTLFDTLARKLPALRNALNVGRLGASTVPTMLAVSFVAGLATNVLGPTRSINLLAFPLLGILGWNLLAYLAMALCEFGDEPR